MMGYLELEPWFLPRFPVVFFPLRGFLLAGFFLAGSSIFVNCRSALYHVMYCLLVCVLK